MIRTILADDEIQAREALHELLSRIDDIEIVAECSCMVETIELARRVKPDLLFLDVRMTGIDGSAIIDELASDPGYTVPLIVVVTADDRYALRAFDIHAVDYLLKPLNPERLATAIQRVRQRRDPNAAKRKAHAKELGRKRYATQINVATRGRIQFLSIEDVRWIKAEENYARICTGRESYLIRETIQSLENRLDPEMFMRVHRSAIVNLRHVREIRRKELGASLILSGGHQVPLSRTYRSRFRDLVGT